MKKNYFLTLLITLCFSFLSYGQDLIITGVIDGPLSYGTPKGLELYVVNNIADLSVYGVESVTNGNASGDAPEFTFPADAVTAGTFIYITAVDSRNATAFKDFLGIDPTYEDGVLSVNGDDPIKLYKDGTAVDVFGSVGTDGTGQPWEYKDGWAYRKDGKSATTTFSNTDWTYSGPDALDGEATNAAASSPFPKGTYKATASTAPTITVTGSTSSFDYFEGHGPSAEQSVTVSGENLTADISVTAPTNFEVSLTSGSGFGSSTTITQTGGNASATLYMRLVAGLTSGNYSGVITGSSAGADDNTGNLEGVVSPADPQFSYTAYLNDFNYIISNGGPSAEDDFTVEGLFLTNDLIVAAPANFELSLTSGSGFGASVSITPTSGTVVETKIYARLAAGLSAGNYTGNITINSTGVEEKTFSVAGNAFGAPTNSMIITGAYDGTLSGGTPKGIELYVLKDITDLSLFGVSSAGNGGGSTAGNIEFPFPSGSATAGTFIYVSTEETNFNTFFGMNPTYTTGSMSINGDDAIELYESGQIIDVFGTVDCDPNASGTTCPEWEHTDGWAYRKSNTGPEGTTFTSTNWTYSGVDGLEGGTNNDTATSPFPKGTYVNTVASVKNNAIEGFAMYPNPVTSGRFMISTISSDAKQVSIFNVLGKKVLTKNISGTKSDIDVSEISSGIYILKVREGNNISTRKLVIK